VLRFEPRNTTEPPDVPKKITQTDSEGQLGAQWNQRRVAEPSFWWTSLADLCLLKFHHGRFHQATGHGLSRLWRPRFRDFVGENWFHENERSPFQGIWRKSATPSITCAPQFMPTVMLHEHGDAIDFAG
jgi:hypothetical protein